MGRLLGGFLRGEPRLVPSGTRIQVRCGRKNLRITGHDRQSGPRQRLAWPVTAINERNKIFAPANIYLALGVDLFIDLFSHLRKHAPDRPGLIDEAASWGKLTEWPGTGEAVNSRCKRDPNRMAGTSGPGR